jgi:hypothetical protein
MGWGFKRVGGNGGDSGESLSPHQEIIARFEEANPDTLVQLEAVRGGTTTPDCSLR